MRTQTIGAAKKKAGRSGWIRRYRPALRQYLKHGRAVDLRAALALGYRAVALGMDTLDVARNHEKAMMLPASREGSLRTRSRRIERADRFFVEVLVPMEKTRRTARMADLRVSQLTRILRRRTLESAASGCRLKRNILMRQGAEHALRKSGEQHAKILADLRRLQKQLRDLTRMWLSTREHERRRMSVRLHDEIAQALIAIDLRLLTFKKAVRAGAASLKNEIAGTERLVGDSVQRIERFAHEFGIRHES